MAHCQQSLAGYHTSITAKGRVLHKRTEKRTEYYNKGQSITAKGCLLHLRSKDIIPQQRTEYYSKRQRITAEVRVLQLRAGYYLQLRTEYCSKGQSNTAKVRLLQLRSKDIILQQGAAYYCKSKVLQLRSVRI